MITIHPFADQGSFTSVHNAVFDVMMPDLPPNAFKVLCLVIRKTRGWIDRETGLRKESDRLSYSQIMTGTGIKAPATLATALKVLIDRRYILASAGETRWEALTYQLNTALEIEVAPTSKNVVATEIEVGATSKNVVDVPTSKNVVATEIEVGATSKNVVAPTSKIEDTKERVKERKEIPPPPTQPEIMHGGDGEKSKPNRSAPKGIPAHVQYLSDRGVGAARIFTDCNPEATIALYDLMKSDGWGNGAIVDNWKVSPPTPERVKQFEEQRHAENQPQRPAPAQRSRPLRPGERGYSGRS